ncbi:lysophospholipid acyltransferase family protein [Microbacterium sp. APC 3898]|uniref:1-acyl-sn-glycerol-3-phosphate acyltransferase n=1 Tax=Planococcus notacanthi TaxID=3035188 RepID=A0ABT7ZGZ5_9BACL|nr:MULTISPECIES: lysophospholipid acyltransferase family protein [Terrabacteria group]MDN3426399.1 lysophospholipid acyltransferase family protein [Planococcus sp. APC 4016]MDN3498095.1 lysophospholipid acyltransferase family protein [Microbacterium sp. APC 3898]
MLNSIRTFSFLFGYLPLSTVNLKKFIKQKPQLSVQEYDQLIHTEPQKWATGIMKRTQSNVTITGLEKLPEGPVLFVSNHEGNFDIPVLLSKIPKPFGFISKKEVKKLPIIPLYMEQMNCVFLDRTDRRSALKSITDTVGKLKEGHSILIFPEGTRSKGEGMGEFKSGFMRIAKDSGVPIQPIAILGTSEIMEKNNNKVLPADVAVQLLDPIPADVIEQLNAKEAIHLVRSKIEEAIAGLSRQTTNK